MTRRPPAPTTESEMQLATDWYTYGFQAGMEAERKAKTSTPLPTETLDWPIYAMREPAPNDNSKAVGDFTRVLKDQGMLDQDGMVKR